MAKKPVLVVMAAGMGSRYGGLKQIDPVGSQGEAILDYSIYDAHQAGFETVVIIIKEAIRKDFMATVGKAIPEGRVKPWGTSHAVLCAKEQIDGAPFAVINSDDYYGKAAFKVIFDALSSMTDPNGYCMVGYELGKTVTENGSVARGVCQTDAKGYLTEVIERTSFLDEIEDRFAAFLKEAIPNNPLKCEYFLPLPVSQLIKEGKATVKVLTSPDRWFGVTYAADKPVVVAALKAMTDEGKYPDGLWK